MLAGLLWKMLIDAFDSARKAIPAADWLEVRYEDVAANPRTAFAKMLEFCGLPWDAEFERGFERHTFTASRSDAFRRDLAADDVERLSRILASRARGEAATADQYEPRAVSSAGIVFARM